MRKVLQCAVLAGLVLALVGVPAPLPAAKPPPGPDAKAPPYQRLLTGALARKAGQLEQELLGHWQAGRFEAALQTAESLAAFRARVQGADHWEAVSARWDAEAVRRTLKQDAATRQQVSRVLALQRRAEALLAKGQAREAQPLLEQILAVRRKVLGEEHPDTAQSYNNLAYAVDAQGRYADALPLYMKALAIQRRVLGEQHPGTAGCYNNVAYSLYRQGRSAEGEPLLQKALAIRRKALGEEHPDTAQSYNSLAYGLNDQGRYADALPLGEKALTIRRKALGEEHPDTALSYNNLAYTLAGQGRYAAAQLLYQKALAIRRKVLGEEHPDTALNYGVLAFTLSAQRRYADAQLLYEKALAIYRKALGEEHPDTANCYDALAYNLSAQGRFADADKPLRKALAIRLKVLGEEHPDTAASYNNLAKNLLGQGKYAAAEPFFQKALAIWRRLLGEEHPFTVACYSSLATNLHAQGKYAAAEQLCGRGADSFMRARLRVAASGLARASFAGERSPLSFLAAVLARNGKPRAAWRRFEEGLARGTWDDLSARRRRTPAEQDRQTALAQSLNRLDKLVERTFAGKETPEAVKRRRDLLGQRRQLLDELADFAQQMETKYGPAAGQVFDRAAIQKALPADAALVGWVDIPGRRMAADSRGEHWSVLLRSQGEPAWEKLPGSGKGGAWTEDDTRLPADLHQTLQEPGTDWRPLAERLRRQRLGPLARHLAAHDGLPAVRQLIVLPSPALDGLPVEVFAEGYTVSYAPSGTLFAHLHQQPKLESRGVLALADPAFAGPKDKDAPPPLPGTRAEAEALGRLCQGAGVPFRLLAGSQASEQDLFELARSGELGRCRYLHLATHGHIDDRLPLQSAVLLARDKLPDPIKQLEAGRPVFDGRLTAEKILRQWHLGVELVTLSACQTALGKYEGGEGFLGFSQALLVAGSRSVCQSLWKVDDTATALLMQRFYQNLLGRRPGLQGPMPKAEALAEAQSWLRTLSVKEAEALASRLPAAERIGTAPGVVRQRPRPSGPRPYAHPYYWAAFILVGDPR